MMNGNYKSLRKSKTRKAVLFLYEMFKTQVDNIEMFQEIHSKYDISLQQKESMK